MRVLQYPRVISVQSFQQPNFELVADLLYWMVHRYNPETSIHNSISTEKDRVTFITGVVKSVYQIANLKLNARKIYLADGHAVKELLKLATCLSKTVLAVKKEQSEKNVSEGSASSTHNSSDTLSYMKGGADASSSSDFIDLNDVKELRRLASEITENGAKLYEYLQVEQQQQRKSQREEGIKFLDTTSTGFDDSPELQHLESVLLQSLEGKKNEVDDIERECRVMESDIKDLTEEMKKKTLDLERNQKRLESIKSARPAFMDEYERLEIELQRHYDLYMERYRNVHYLKKEMETFQKEEEEKVKVSERSQRRLQSRIQEEELKILRDDHSTYGRSKKLERKSKADGADVPLLDTTEDSSIIIYGGDDDDSGADRHEIFIEHNDPISVGDSSSPVGTSTRRDSSKDENRTILSSKASSSFSIVSVCSTNGMENESDSTTFNKSTDSDDNF